MQTLYILCKLVGKGVRMKAKELFDILQVATQLKETTRHCWTNKNRQESVAEHSWRLCLFALLVEDEFKEVDMNKVIRMCIIHDLGEAFTGDIPAFDKTQEDRDKEHTLFKEWMQTFPSPIKESFLELFVEMEKLESIEAKLYKALDKLEAVIAHNESDISTWLPLEYDLQLEYGKENVQFSNYLVQLKALVDIWTKEKIKEEGKMSHAD